MLVGLVLVVLCANGCSFAFVNGPPAGKHIRPEQIDCSENYVPPMLDTVLAVPLGAGGIAAATYSGCGGDCPTRSIGQAMLVPAALFVVSAAYGYIVTSSCHVAIADAEDRFDHVTETPAEPRWDFREEARKKRVQEEYELGRKLREERDRAQEKPAEPLERAPEPDNAANKGESE